MNKMGNENKDMEGDNIFSGRPYLDDPFYNPDKWKLIGLHNALKGLEDSFRKILQPRKTPWYWGRITKAVYVTIGALALGAAAIKPVCRALDYDAIRTTQVNEEHVEQLREAGIEPASSLEGVGLSIDN